ncbi:hypothetical protein UUU_38110 [Klebsiella pneumoniae subsp. pneumoniae DSM 30104 = JCM 1662 = NBRC 14940]|nr:hypothetical protein UUU_38110 [Klebsiella pneumoniae subsp. pneumoniae DSM 30104 = JCM 1662 = NBRC 14940]
MQQHHAQRFWHLLELNGVHQIFYIQPQLRIAFNDQTTLEE